MAKSDGPRTTLVTRFSALGDVAMTLPLLYNVARSNPQRHFVMLTRPHAAGIFINSPENVDVVGVDMEKYGSPAGIVKLCRRLSAQYDIDTYADLHDVLRTKIMRLVFRLKGVKTAHIHKHRKARRALTRPNDKNLVPLTPVSVLYADVFTRLGIRRDKSFVSLFGADDAPAQMLSPIVGEGVEKHPDEVWIAVAPFARHPGKVYPLEHTRKVVEHFAAEPSVRLFLLGAGAEEQAVLEGWCAGHDNITNVAAKRAGIAAEIALLSHCDVLLSMDSANMHLASLVGCPVVSIWGATHPYTGFYGRCQPEDNAVQLALPCRPCSIYGNRPCRRGDYLCLNGLSPEVVIARIKRVCAMAH